MKIGVIKERKTPPDFRVPLVPEHCAQLLDLYQGLELCVEQSDMRSYTDDEYKRFHIPVTDNMSDCDVLMGVKEVPPSALIPNKTYLFFSHTIKKQPYNRHLLQEVLKKQIRLIDYECLKDEKGQRLIGFGRFAGIVGAYNALRGWGLRIGKFNLKPAHQCLDSKDLYAQLENLDWGNLRVVLTGGGRVAYGVIETLHAAGFKQIDWPAFISGEGEGNVFTQIEYPVYNRRKDGTAFTKQDFYAHPELFESDFHRFMHHADIYIAGHFWSSVAPRFFTSDDLLSPDNRIQLIADISCDIDGPIPSTIRASSIPEPFYGYNPQSQKESAPFDASSITVMAVDNLPCELPRDASDDFSKTLTSTIIPLLINEPDHAILQRATIVENGMLTSHYQYLSDYVAD